MNSETGIGARSAQPSTLRKEVETCGLCHARRGSFHEDWLPGQWLSQTHVVEPLARTTYHSDGQIRDNEEPYNYTPFKEGKMFAAGVTCSDCHEPHSAKLRASGEGVCLQCHAPARFADAGHHHHGGIEPQPTCISCHMQTRNYMVVDPRHDHTFRVPRPDLSVTSGTPNACNDCHRDKSAEWAATAVDQWFGASRKGFQSFGAAFHAARNEQADAAALLAAVASESTVPGVARATALSELASLVSPSNIAVARKALSDPDPMVRIGALDMLASLPATQIWALASPLLTDPVRGVRIRAASVLAAVPDTRQPREDRARFDQAAAEFVDAQRANAERPEARTTLANFFAQRGRTAEAEAEYRAALRLSSQYVVAAINLADLYRQLGRETEGEAVLREAVTMSPRDAAVHHALGLNLTRQKRPELALAEFQTASRLEPDRTQYPYVYAVALHSAGKVDEAITVLRQSLTNHPNDRSILSALLAFSRTSGDMQAALDYAQRLALVSPDDPNLTRVIGELRRAVLPAPREQR